MGERGRESEAGRASARGVSPRALIIACEVPPKCAASSSVWMEKLRERRRAPLPVLHRRLPDAYRKPEGFESRRASPGPGRFERRLDLLPHLPEPEQAPFPDGGLLERLRAVGPCGVQPSAAGRGNGLAGH